MQISWIELCRSIGQPTFKTQRHKGDSASGHDLQPIVIIRNMKSKSFSVALTAAFVLTVVAARLFSVFFPRVHWEPVAGLHIHHYVYGIFLLTIAGYLALIFKGPRSTRWIALLYGLGVGLTFDEFGMWFNPPFVRGVRWNTNGIVYVVIPLAIASLVPILLSTRLQIFKHLRPGRILDSGKTSGITATAGTDEGAGVV
jgi:hypothetical protein